MDGTNLLHALRRGGLPPATLVGRLRAVIPPETSIELVFDGAPDRGMRRERVASGLMVTYSWPRTADAAIYDRLAGLDAEAADHLLAVTDDRALRQALEYRGARTARSAWLLGRLDMRVNAAPTSGNAHPPAPPPVGSGAGRRLEVDKDEDTGPGWSPGRGATAKTGNGRKGPRNGLPIHRRGGS